jgi:hypothetical protein
MNPEMLKVTEEFGLSLNITLVPERQSTLLGNLCFLCKVRSKVIWKQENM